MKELAATIALLLAQNGLGPDALLVPDNLLRHEAAPPAGAAPLARELLAQPLQALDAAAIFRRAVPASIVRFAEEGPAPAARPFDEVLGEYVRDVETAQKAFAAAARAPFDAAPLLRRLRTGLPSSNQLAAAGAAFDPAALDQANRLFLEATARFVRELRAPGMKFPEKRSFPSPIGLVSVGSAGDDHHGPQAALIIDPGGDDTYERAPVSGGAVSVIVDLAGNDRYGGADVVVGGFSALVDLGGDDRYEMHGAGLAAAIGGVSILVDASGDDRYAAGTFGQGAAAFGIGALLDLGGNDRYRLQAGGQGYGLAGGLGLLWDRGGNDEYRAAGFADPYRREAGLSFAQGAASGYRGEGGPDLGGGIGILRDERGDDVYEAEMFAQGLGYYYGVGLLWDEEGADRYRAVRYAQGNGVHQAAGILRDEAGDDRYELSYGVGQGMGLDMALGVLVDAAGDDRYGAGILAQGTATANGIGILFDFSGDDAWEMSTASDQRHWGRAQWYRGLPGVGLFSHAGAGRFIRAGAEVRPPESASVEKEPQTPPGAKVGAGAALAAPCGVQASALAARPSVEAAQKALRSTCWRLQAAALEALQKLGATPEADIALPSFLPR